MIRIWLLLASVISICASKTTKNEPVQLFIRQDYSKSANLCNQLAIQDVKRPSRVITYSEIKKSFHSINGLPALECLLVKNLVRLPQNESIVMELVHFSASKKSIKFMTWLLTTYKPQESICYTDKKHRSMLHLILQNRLFVADLAKNNLQLSSNTSKEFDWLNTTVSKWSNKMEFQTSISRVLSKHRSSNPLQSQTLFLGDIELIANTLSLQMIKVVFAYLHDHVPLPIQVSLMSIRNIYNQSVLDFAIQLNNADAVKLIMQFWNVAINEKGVSIDLFYEFISSKTSFGVTVFDIAQAHGSEEIRDILKRVWNILPIEMQTRLLKSRNDLEVEMNHLIEKSQFSSTNLKQKDFGGWDIVPPPPAGSLAAASIEVVKKISRRSCSVPVIDSTKLSVIELAHMFAFHFYQQHTPVIIRNWGLDSVLLNDFSFSNLNASHFNSDLEFKVASLPYSRAYGGTSSSMTMREYMEYLLASNSASKKIDAALDTLPQEEEFANNAPRSPMYIFEAPHSVESLFHGFNLRLDFLNRPVVPLTHADEFGNSFHPLMAANSSSPKPQFYLGPAGSGAPIHFHKDAVNFLVYGEKEWFLFPPNRSMYSTIPIAEWVTNEEVATSYLLGRQGADAAIQCTQLAGDLMYVPYEWGHGVLNLEPSIGVAIEFSCEQSMF
jgi:hypothetical protein